MDPKENNKPNRQSTVEWMTNVSMYMWKYCMYIYMYVIKIYTCKYFKTLFIY